MTKRDKANSGSDAAFAAHVGTSALGMSAVAMLGFANIVGEQTPEDLIAELRKRVKEINDGEMDGVEAMLMGQAIALQAIFANFAHRAAENAGDHRQSTETYMKLALRAQSQCRATLETLATMKSPPFVYAQQANVTTGPQQINNGVAREIESEHSKLSVEAHELLKNPGASCVASGTHQTVGAVGAKHRPEDAGR